MIDFTKIRSTAGGQRNSFEELVCQLARREAAPAGAGFRRVEGAGGDGGVEAYWLLPGGAKIGYQAKYFIRSGDIDWAQIDESVKQALDTHQTLSKYIIAIPCDLTDRRGAKSKGRTGWELWDSHKAEWQRKWLSPTGRAVEFVPWTAFELRNKLAATAADGLRRYWFASAEFTSAWFQHHIRLATASLDERYHPEDHVDVGLERLFQFATRDVRAIKTLEEALTAIRRAPFPDRRLRGHEPALPSHLLDEANTRREAVLALAPDFHFPSWSEWNSVHWKRCAEDLIDSVTELHRWAWDARSVLENEKDTKAEQDINFILNDLHKLSEAIEAFEHLAGGKFLAAERDRVALIEGRAGTGKSHLLGCIAEEAAKDGHPVILLLGQQLSEQPLWDQITRRLGLSNLAPDAFLQALDAAAEAARKRGMILVDAVNEGGGARLWKPEVAEFLERVKRFPNLICVITCRTEYVPYIFPSGVLAKIQRLEIRGFESTEEQLKAARVYMDKRGISRPSTPWIAPEFVNPLFLRSTCLALNREKKSEFPRGLHGTKEVLSFYLKSVARNLGVGRDGSDDLVPPTIATLREIAAQMAANRVDFVSLAEATDIANSKFATFHMPSDHSWLEVLQRNGLLRSDPDPAVDASDPLAIPVNVMRFSFQRFQDHLMAETLLEAVSDIRAALASDGSLTFIHDGKMLQWKWRGLVEALSIQVPERFGVELVDALPGEAPHWWHVWEVPDAFAESVRWRSKTAFGERTLELLNGLPDTNVDQLGLLIELSVSVDHPWNADLLHRNLLQRKLPQRDRFWTTWLNDASVDGGDPVGRLIDWSLFGQSTNTDRAAQRLCAIMLCWFFTASNRYVRDGATKALVSLLIARSDLFPELCTLFKDVDDIYVSERLLAAAFGACCINPSRPRLESYAINTFNIVFSEERAPLSLLLRDYARGIIELALAKSCLPAEVTVEKCRPPYRSAPARLRISEETLRNTAGKAGDETILHSCDSFAGDFGTYEIKPRVGSFTAVTLKRPQPVSNRELFERFEAEVIDIDERRISAVKMFREKHFQRLRLPFGGLNGNQGEEDTAELEKWASEVIAAQEAFLSLLSPAEKRRYRKEAAQYLGLNKARVAPDIPEIDIVKARRWVVKRAYDIGWTKKLFPNDSSRYRGHSRERPHVERIGKKYQWIALDELLCRLADNYWVGGRYGDKSKVYDNPLDIGFERDIDPTIIPLNDDVDNSQGPRPNWIAGTKIELASVAEEELAAWPFLADPASNLGDLIHRNDDEGRSWVTLYEHRSTTERYDDGEPGSHTLRQQEFRFVMCVIVANADRARLAAFLEKAKSLDVMGYPLDFIDGPFLREAPWRDTWAQNQWRYDIWKAPKGMAISFPAYRYHWESHLDASLPEEGASALIPSPWLARAMALSAEDYDASVYKNAASQIVFIGSTLGEDGSSALVAKDALDHYLDANDLQCFWLFVGERNARPGGDNGNAAWRRSEGICWLEDGKPVIVNWNNDNANGASKTALAKRFATNPARTKKRPNTRSKAFPG